MRIILALTLAFFMVFSYPLWELALGEMARVIAGRGPEIKDRDYQMERRP